MTDDVKNQLLVSLSSSVMKDRRHGIGVSRVAECINNSPLRIKYSSKYVLHSTNNIYS